MSETMRERVARAIFECRAFGAPVMWVPGGNSLNQDEAREFAEAVLSAMRDPTGAMKDAGAESYGLTDIVVGPAAKMLSGQPSKAWMAMIDAAGEP